MGELPFPKSLPEFQKLLFLRAAALKYIDSESEPDDSMREAYWSVLTQDERMAAAVIRRYLIDSKDVSESKPVISEPVTETPKEIIEAEIVGKETEEEESSGEDEDKEDEESVVNESDSGMDGLSEEERTKLAARNLVRRPVKLNIGREVK